MLAAGSPPCRLEPVAGIGDRHLRVAMREPGCGTLGARLLGESMTKLQGFFTGGVVAFTKLTEGARNGGNQIADRAAANGDRKGIRRYSPPNAAVKPERPPWCRTPRKRFLGSRSVCRTSAKQARSSKRRAQERTQRAQGGHRIGHKHETASESQKPSTAAIQ
jgi:hypothetical protein